MVENEKRFNKRQPRLSNTAVKAISENVNLDQSQEELTSSEIDCDSTTSDTTSSKTDEDFRPSSSFSRPRSVTLEMNTNLIAKKTNRNSSFESRFKHKRPCLKMLDYQKLEKFVSTAEVVNDCAERSIKLISCFKMLQRVKNNSNMFSKL